MNILLFSMLREAIGASAVQVEVSLPAKVASVLEAASNQNAVIAKNKTNIRIAVNGTFVEDGAWIKDTDEIAFITPVSGG